MRALDPNAFETTSHCSGMLTGGEHHTPDPTGLTRTAALPKGAASAPIGVAAECSRLLKKLQPQGAASARTGAYCMRT
jgi:hypothetical protein